MSLKKDDKKKDDKQSKGFRFYNIFRKTRGFERTLEAVPPLVSDSIAWLRSHNALVEEGLFRVPGSAIQIKEIKARYDKGKKVDLAAEENVHTVAGVLKVFFRELPEPMLTFELYEAFLAALRPRDLETRLEYLAKVVQSLPPANRLILNELIGFLNEVSHHSAKNCMTSTNLAIVFAPNLIRPRVETMEIILANTSSVNTCIQLMIHYYEFLFLGTEVSSVKDEQISLSPHLISIKAAQEKFKGTDGTSPSKDPHMRSTSISAPGTAATTDTKTPRKHIGMRGRTASSSATLTGGQPPIRRKSSKNLAKNGEGGSKKKKDKTGRRATNAPPVATPAEAPLPPTIVTPAPEPTTEEQTTESSPKKKQNRKSFYDTLKIGTIKLAESLLEEQSLVLEIEEVEKLSGQERVEAEEEIKEKLKKDRIAKKEHKKNQQTKNRQLRDNTFAPPSEDGQVSTLTSLLGLFVPPEAPAGAANATLPPPIPTMPILPPPPEEDIDDHDDEEDAEDDALLGLGIPAPLGTSTATLPAPLEVVAELPQVLDSAVTGVVESVIGGDMQEFNKYLGGLKKMPRMERQKSKKALLARINQTKIITPNLSSSSISEAGDESEEDEEYDSTSGEEDENVGGYYF